MEVLGSPPISPWVEIEGLPLQAWHEGIFKLLGDCIGRTVDVDERTQKKEFLMEGRIKVLIKNTVTLPISIPVWVEDLKFLVLVKHDEEVMRRREGKEGSGE